MCRSTANRLAHDACILAKILLAKSLIEQARKEVEHYLLKIDLGRLACDLDRAANVQQSSMQSELEARITF